MAAFRKLSSAFSLSATTNKTILVRHAKFGLEIAHKYIYKLLLLVSQLQLQ